MKQNINIEAEKNELILRNEAGDYAIIPAKHRFKVQKMIDEGCNDCIDSLVETLPVASQYAQDGSVYPPNKKVKVNQDNQIKEYDISSPEYRDLYNTGRLMSYDKTSDTYTATPLKEVTITAEAPQRLKDKRQFEKEYSKDRFIDETMPKFSRSMGISSTNQQVEYSPYVAGSKEIPISQGKTYRLNNENELVDANKDKVKEYLGTYSGGTSPEVKIIAEDPQWVKDRKNKKVNKINFWESLNYKKWGLNDYSDYSSFNSAFRNARESNEKEFVYKDNRYNTNLISKEQSDLYHESKQFLSDYYKNNGFKPININMPYDIKDKYIKNKYGITWSEYYEQVKNSGSYDINSKDFDKIQQRLDELDTYNKDFDNDENYKIFVDNYIKSETEKQKQIELNNLQEPYYFSITDQKPKDLKEDGYLNSGRKKIFLTTNSEKDKLNTTYIHELSHKADDYSVYSRIPKIDIDYINKNRDIYPLNQEAFDYLQDPSEIEARKMSLLFFAYKNKIDVTKMNDSEFDKFYTDNFDKFPYDIKQLFNLYSFQRKDLLKYIKNDFSYLQSQQNKSEK